MIPIPNNFSDPKNKIQGHLEIHNGPGLDLIIWLHGNGPVDGQSQGGSGSLKGLEYYASLTNQVPFMVNKLDLPVDTKKYNWMFPQSADGGLQDQDLVNFIKYGKQRHQSQRVVLMGHSMGGGKVFKLLDSENSDVADLYVPSAGSYDAYTSFNPYQKPVWAFVGDKDTKFFSKTLQNFAFAVGKDRYYYMNQYREIMKEREAKGTTGGRIAWHIGLNNLWVYVGADHGIVLRMLKEEQLWVWIEETLIKINGKPTPAPEPEPVPEPTPEPTPTRPLKDLSLNEFIILSMAEYQHPDEELNRKIKEETKYRLQEIKGKYGLE